MAFYKHPLVVKEFAGWNAMPYLSSVLPNNEFVGRGKAPKNVEDFKGMRVRALGRHRRCDAQARRRADLGRRHRSLHLARARHGRCGGLPDHLRPPVVPHLRGRQVVHREHGRWANGRLPDPDPCRSLGRAAAAVQGRCSRRRSRSPTPPSRRPIARPTRRTSRCSRRSCEFIKFTPDELAAFRKAGGQPVWEEWVVKREGQGIPARELLNFLLKQAGVAAEVVVFIFRTAGFQPSS